MNNFWRFFITYNRFSFLAVVALLCFGAYSIVAIPKESAPEVQIPIGIVNTILPGASAQDIESLITNKVEQGLSGNLNDIKKITSTSREGVSSVVVEFNASADIDKSITTLKDEVDKIVPELPADAEDPFVSEVNFVDQPILNVAVAGDVSPADFAILAENLENNLELLPGVARVETTGVQKREVAIIVDRTKLEQFSLTLNEIVGAIGRANVNFPVGSITTNGVAYNVAFEGDITETSDISNVPVGNRGGQPVYVRDVATVEDGYKAATTISRLSVDGKPTESAISLNIFKARGGDITAIARSVNERLAELQAPGKLLDGYTVNPILDSGEQIETDLIRLSSSGLQTVFLVVLLLIFAIGWREGILAGIAIPLSFTIGFIGLYLSGNTINFVSLFALILAVGILVDSAIVIVEGINRRMKDNPSINKKQAAIDTVNEFSAPLTSGTLTTVAMFSGLFLISGVSGQFISAIPFTINFVLFASLLVALGFIPLFGSIFLRRRNLSKMEVLQQQYSHKLESWYQSKLDNFLQNRKQKIFFASIIMIGFFAAMSLPFIGAVKVIFFDQEDIDWIYAGIEMPQATELTTTDIVARRAEEILYANPNIDSFVTTVGASSAFSDNSGGAQGSKLANYFITLRKDRELTSTEVVDMLRQELSVISDAKVSVGQPSNGPPTGSPLVVRFLGSDLDELTESATAAANYLKTLPGTTNIETSTNNNSTEFVLELNRAKASAFGLDSFTVSQTLRTAVFGTEATSIVTPQDDIAIVVKLALNPNYLESDDTNNVTIDVIKNLAIKTPSGESVLVGTIADIKLRESSAVINHEGGERIISLSSDLTSDGNLREISAEFLANVREKANIPDSVHFEIGGENEESNQAFVEMFLSLIVGIILMLAILVIQFNSFRHTFYVLSILPFSLIGIMVGLALTGKALSFPSLMGFVALSGIVVNNSILLIDQMNSNRRRNPELPLRETVVTAAVSRLRPVLLTTLTTVIGIFPLTFASDLWSPLAYAIMFGLSFSVFITLILIPLIYLNKPGKLN